MFSWWVWLLVWAVLVLGGGALIAWRTRRAWRSFRALTAEAGRAGRLAGALGLEAEIPNLAPPGPPRVDVFVAPSVVRRERDEVRAALRQARRLRFVERRPGWSRSVD